MYCAKPSTDAATSSASRMDDSWTSGILDTCGAGADLKEAVSMMVSGFCRDVFNQLPMEFAAEADKLLALKLEASVG